MVKKSAESNTPPETVVTPNDLGWTDYVLSLLSDDEKIAGNPTTDGLRRVFEIAMNCVVIDSSSNVVQTPDPQNEKRATVVHSISYVLKNIDPNLEELKYRSVSGSADVYWGNCDKAFRNHPVAVAETRAEGRALRRGLKLRKVVAAEEIAAVLEDDPDGNNVSKISSNQINFIDVLAQRLNINVLKLVNTLDISFDTVYNITHEDAIKVIRHLNVYQQDTSSIAENIMGYQPEWK
jgi:hypothetical protein